MSVCLSCVSVCLSACRAVCLCVVLRVCLSVCLSACPSALCVSACLGICFSFHISVGPSVRSRLKSVEALPHHSLTVYTRREIFWGFQIHWNPSWEIRHLLFPQSSSYFFSFGTWARKLFLEFLTIHSYNISFLMYITFKTPFCKIGIALSLKYINLTFVSLF